MYVDKHVGNINKKHKKNLVEKFIPLFLHSQNKMSQSFCKKKNDSVAQLVEQYTFNVWALGPSPSGITKSYQVKTW